MTACAVQQRQRVKQVAAKVKKFDRAHTYALFPATRGIRVVSPAVESYILIMMIDNERLAEQKAQALSRVRDYNVWLVLQPSGNIYLTSHKRTASKCEVVLGVVRRGTDVYEPLAPPCWLPREEREPAAICERPTKIDELCRLPAMQMVRADRLERESRGLR
jgi:hypothetical protein